MFLLTVGGVCWPHTLLFAAKVDASRYVRWYHWMGTDSNICVDTDIRVNETLRNGVRCTGMLACESFFFLLLEGEITITRCTLVARMMKRGPPLGIAPVSMMHSLEMMIDSLPFSTVSPPPSLLLLFIKLSGSKWSALPFWASGHCLLKVGGGMFASRFPLPRWKSTGLQKLCVSGCHLQRFYSVTLSVQSHLEPVEAHEQTPIWSGASISSHSLESLTCMCVCASLISASCPVRRCCSFQAMYVI